ncbi:MAG: hypothetical protein KA010_03550 [Saprospiraceae bacterium]|nr:hypothetical protein [Saprospiraceae bacterium]
MYSNIKVGILTLSLILTIQFIGCKSDPKESSNDGNVVNIRLSSEPDKLCPLLTINSYSLRVLYHIFPSLITYDPKTLELSPFLAVELPKVEKITSGEFKGGTSYEYQIHPEAKWDNGTPVTGYDYIFTLKAIFNPKCPTAPYRGYLEYIRDVQVDPSNPKKFKVMCDGVYINAAEETGRFSILPAYIYDEKGLMKDISLKDLLDPKKSSTFADKEPKLQEFADAWTQPKFSREKGSVVGCGAYQFEEWVTGERIVLTKKKNWWGEKLADKYPLLTAIPDKFVYKPVVDNATAVAMFKNGLLDVLSSIPAQLFISLRDESKSQEIGNYYNPPVLAFNYIALNGGNNVKLSDRNVRSALAHLVDADQIIKTIGFGLGERLVGPIHPSKEYYNTDLKPITLDVEKAKSLLSSAGWKDTNGNGTVDKVINGKTVEMDLTLMIPNGNDVVKSMSLLIQKDAKKAGVNINISTKEFPLIKDDMKRRDYDMAVLSASLEPSLDDPYQFWHTESNTPDGSNRFGFGNKESDKLIDEIRTTLDRDKRNALYKKFQEIIYFEQPVIFLYAPYERLAINRRFENAEATALRPGYYENYFSTAKKPVNQ